MTDLANGKQRIDIPTTGKAEACDALAELRRLVALLESVETSSVEETAELRQTMVDLEQFLRELESQKSDEGRHVTGTDDGETHRHEPDEIFNRIDAARAAITQADQAHQLAQVAATQASNAGKKLAKQRPKWKNKIDGTASGKTGNRPLLGPVGIGLVLLALIVYSPELASLFGYAPTDDDEIQATTEDITAQQRANTPQTDAPFDVMASPSGTRFADQSPVTPPLLADTLGEPQQHQGVATDDGRGDGTAPAADAAGDPFAEAANAAAAQKEAQERAEARILALMPRVQEGEATAQYELGLIYLRGLGVDQSYEEAARWLQEAAYGNVAAAQYNLGILRKKGLGIDQDKEKAAALFRAAAEQGYARGQYALGVAYAEGAGIAQNYRRAAGWFRRAADQDVPEAMLALAIVREQGLNAPADLNAALGWYRKAALNGVEAAAAKVAEIEARLAVRDGQAGPPQDDDRGVITELAEELTLQDAMQFDDPALSGTTAPIQ